MNHEPIKRPSPILMAAPTLLVLIGFYAFFYKQLHRQLVARRGELANLQSGQPEVESQIQSLQHEIATLNKRLEDAKAQRQLNAARKSSVTQEQLVLRDRVVAASGQAETMNQLASLMLKRGLAIVGNQARTIPDQSIHRENERLLGNLDFVSGQGSAKTATRPLDEDSSSRSPTGENRYVAAMPNSNQEPIAVAPKRQYEITVQGSFRRVKETIEQITAECPNVTITSVELEPVDLRYEVRTWKLSVLL